MSGVAGIEWVRGEWEEVKPEGTKASSRRSSVGICRFLAFIMRKKASRGSMYVRNPSPLLLSVQQARPLHAPSSQQSHIYPFSLDPDEEMALSPIPGERKGLHIRPP